MEYHAGYEVARGVFGLFHGIDRMVSPRRIWVVFRNGSKPQLITYSRIVGNSITVKLFRVKMGVSSRPASVEDSPIAANGD